MEGLFYKSSNDLPGKCFGCEGVVYALQDGIRCKIGSTINPRSRIKAIETSLGLRFNDMFVSEPCLNFREAEAYLHAKYADRRKIGEWFARDPWTVSIDAEKIDVKREDMANHIEELRAIVNKAFSSLF